MFLMIASPRSGNGGLGATVDSKFDAFYSMNKSYVYEI